MSNELWADEQRNLFRASPRGQGPGWVTGILLTALLAAFPAAAENAGERIANKGAAQAGAVACASCHGADGGGNEQTGFPRLAGLNANYIESQLHAYKQGQRKNPVMSGMAAPLTEQDIKAVAAYYAALTPVSHAKAPDGVATPAGEQLASYGDMANRGLAGCFPSRRWGAAPVRRPARLFSVPRTGCAGCRRVVPAAGGPAVQLSAGTDPGVEVRDTQRRAARSDEGGGRQAHGRRGQVSRRPSRGSAPHTGKRASEATGRRAGTSQRRGQTRRGR